MRNRLREGGLSASRPYVGCVLARRHLVNRVNWACTYQRWLRQQWNSVLFSDESRFTIHRGDRRVRVCRKRNERYADCCTLERDRFGVRVLSWSGRALNMAFALISSSSKDIGMSNATEMKFFRGTLSHCFKIMPIQLFLQHDNATSHTVRDTVNFSQSEKHCIY